MAVFVDVESRGLLVSSVRIKSSGGEDLAASLIDRQSWNRSECVSYSVHGDGASFFVDIHFLVMVRQLAVRFVKIAHNLLSNTDPLMACFALHIVEKNYQDLQPTSNEV